MGKNYFSSVKALDDYIEWTKIPNKEIFDQEKRTVEQIMADIKLDGYTLINLIGKIHKEWIEKVDNVIITEKIKEFNIDGEVITVKTVEDVRKSESEYELKPHPESRILRQINS
ncbi:MAG: hypothetical protein J6C96_00065 [Oscillospiraceae bacterium]|nr:hypothetical protein [Oscillospiraceae bacterium]